MIFWLGIIPALAAGGWAAKRGLYEAWVLLFNVVIAVYLGLAVGPVLQELLGIEGRLWGVFVIFGSAVVCLTVLYGICYVAFLSQFTVTFPKTLDKGGGGLLGFLAGLLAWSFVAFLISASPLSENSIIAKAGFNTESMQRNISYMSWWTEKVHNMVSTEQQESAVKDTVARLVENDGRSTTTRRDRDIEQGAETSAESVDSTAEANKPKPSDLGPPPELDFEDI